ncbi:MAG: Uma2 family endonuclease [Candidatus Eremiobacterota bacterium]
MSEPVTKENKIYTYSDYASWQDGKRYEIIGGKAYSMSPGASDMHQGVSAQLLAEFVIYLRGKKCRAFDAPFDVILPEEGETFENSSNVVQPDIIVVCDKEKITRRGCCGAPDLVVEILSPSSTKRDIKDKRRLYQRYAIKEYWIVDPVNKRVDIYKLNKDNIYDFPEIYAEDDKIKVGIFNDELEIDLTVIFAE